MAYKDKQKELDYQRQYSAENKQKIAERGRRYREENKQKIADKNRQYYEENKQKIRQYTAENKQKIAERERQDRETLTDGYVKKLLTKGSNLRRADIPGDLVDLKRTQIQIMRLIEEKTQ